MSTTDVKEEKKEAKREQKLSLNQAVLDRNLLDAAERGDLATVQDLVAQGADVANAKDDKFGSTALLWATANGRTATAEWLLSHGASITERNNYGNTALLLAACFGHTATVEWLLSHGASITERNNDVATRL